jgi:hypothetical protein
MSAWACASLVGMVAIVPKPSKSSANFGVIVAVIRPSTVAT